MGGGRWLFGVSNRAAVWSGRQGLSGISDGAAIWKGGAVWGRQCTCWGKDKGRGKSKYQAEETRVDIVHGSMC